MFTGIATALITPFTDNGIDYESLRRLIEYQIDAGVDALLVSGTTGEPPTMTRSERAEVIDFAIKTIGGRVPVIVGTGSNSTAQAVANSIDAEKAGADMLLVVTPYYNKCTPEGLYAHYKAINDAVNIPIMAYNVPGRTGVNITPASALRLSTLEHVTALKDAAGNLSQTCDTAVTLKNTDFTIYSGDDGLCIPMMSVGAKGLISVASNVIPGILVDMVHGYLNGDREKALELFLEYRPFFEGLFIEANPIAIKYACSKIGLCRNILRLPLTPLSDNNAKTIDKLMKDIEVR